jgi:DivIVA domain-containing protein
MALTPEDVVNKRFQPTKFREGYDQDEVDDFLDEVVVELRRLGQENEELRQRVAAGGTQFGDAQRGGMAPAPTPVAEPVAATGFAGADPSVDPNDTNNLLVLARRLHEEHVREGIEKRDSLIAEGHATAARIVSEAQQQQRAELNSLDQERRSLEGRVEDLRAFEREYRAKLKSHIEGILHDLDGVAVPAGVNAQSASAPVPSGQSSPMQQPVNYGGVPAQPETGFPGFGGN